MSEGSSDENIQNNCYYFAMVMNGSYTHENMKPRLLWYARRSTLKAVNLIFNKMKVNHSTITPDSTNH